MSINKSEIVKSITLQMNSALQYFITGLTLLKNLQDWRSAADEGSEIDFKDYESNNAKDNIELFGENAEYDELQHLDGDMINLILGKIIGPNDSVIDSIEHHLKNTTIQEGTHAGKTYWQILQMSKKS